MKCKYCGAEIKEGDVYCFSCGKEVQVVPDFDELEEELLPAIVSKEKSSKKNAKNRNDNKKKSGNKRLTGIVIGVLVFAVIIIGIGIYTYFNSYSYAFNKANSLDKKKKYEQAVEYYNIALDRKLTVEALLACGIDLDNIGEFSASEELLLEALDIAPDDVKVRSDIYKALFSLYDETDNYDAIEDIIENNTDSRYDDVFDEYYIRPPEFSEDEGDYDTDIQIELESPDGYDIYYTTDDTTPSSHNGTLYSKPIEIEKGETTISACCVNDSGKWGRVISKTYSITYKAPPKPSASPSSGNFHEPMFVELTTRVKNAQIYYTWDGTEPTKSSSKYEAPIPIPEGNNVLSAIVIDEHDMASKILRCNYVYIP